MGEIKITPEELRNRAKLLVMLKGKLKIGIIKYLMNFLICKPDGLAHQVWVFDQLPTLNKACESYITHFKKLKKN